MKTNINALSLAEGFLKEAREKKVKSAADETDPTSQPVMKADDGTIKATTGSRASENASDVKSQYGSGGVAGQEDASSAPQTHATDTIGTQKMDADSMKGNVKEPKSTLPKPPESPNHPSNATFSEKYSALRDIDETNQRVFSLISGLAKTANETMKAPPAVTPPTLKDQAPGKAPAAAAAAPKKKDEKEPEPAKTAAEAAPSQEDLRKLAMEKYPDDVKAGYDIVNGILTVITEQAETEKKASEAATEKIETIIKAAHADADLYADYLDGFIAGQKKQADDLSPGGADGAPEGAGGGLPPELAGAGGPPPGAGGPPPGGGHEGGGDQQVIDMLAKLLAENGITEDELAAAIQQADAGGAHAGAGADAGGGAPPPEGDAAGAAGADEGAPKAAALAASIKKLAGTRQQKFAAVLKKLVA